MSDGFRDIFGLMFGWHGDPWPFDVTGQTADDVIRRSPDSADDALRRNAGTDDDVLRRHADTADNPLRRW